MKNIFICLFLSLLSFSVFAQENVFPYKNVLKLSPFEFGKAEFQLSYEHYFKNRQSSIMLSPSFILKEGVDESRNGWQLMTQYRFYLTHLSRQQNKSFLGIYDIGFYSGIYAQYLNYTENSIISYWNNVDLIEVNNKKQINSEEGGAIIGLQFDITSRITADFFVGGGIRYSQVENSAKIEDDLYSYDPGIFDYNTKE